jgi:hypothetical protein
LKLYLLDKFYYDEIFNFSKKKKKNTFGLALRRANSPVLLLPVMVKSSPLL